MILHSLTYPVLHVTQTILAARSGEAGDGFSDPLFTGEFTDARKHADPKLTNYGYILGVNITGGLGHAVCVVRQYPFDTYGDQSLIVLDSCRQKVLRFPSHIEMTQYLRSVFPGGLDDFISIYGYSQKKYEPTARRGTIRSMYEQNLASLNAIAVPSAAAPSAAAPSAAAPSAAGALSLASAGGGSGSTGLGGGQTFYSFYSL
jgi:hypothetical protein